MANSADFKAVIEQMKNAGVRFVTDKSDLDFSEAYAVLGSKSAIKYLQDEADGINGFVILCADDEVDMNRLCSVLDRAYYDTDDEKRPYKVQFNIDELQKVINILKMNSLNVAYIDRTINKPQGTTKRSSAPSVRSSGPVTWIVSANAWFDTVKAFDEMRTLDWDQGKYRFKEGDIVYIYLGRPIMQVRLKCKVVKANMDHTEIDDRKYVIDITDEELEYDFEPEYGGVTMQLTVLTEYKESDLFSFKALNEHGIVGSIRTPRTITGEAMEYFRLIDVPENIEKSYED